MRGVAVTDAVVAWLLGGVMGPWVDRPGPAQICECIFSEILTYDSPRLPKQPQLSTPKDAAGLPMVEAPQNVMLMSEPMKELGARIMAGRIKQDGNPLLTWMIGNVVAKVDVKENVYPRKARYENKIDGAVAAIIAMNQQLFHVKGTESAYANATQIVI